MSLERAKRAAAEAAVALVEDGMRVGLGTGSTARFAIEALGQRIRLESLRIVAIPTSQATETLARKAGIPLGGFAEIDELDLAIDGADEVERATLNLIKGGGGALLREKIVAQAAHRFVVVADTSKLVDRLGAFGLPVECVRFGHEWTGRRLADLGGTPVLRRADGGAPAVTDGGNLIQDCAGFAPILDPWALERQIASIAGVVETGLFLDMAECAFVGGSDGSVETLYPDPA
jgi:ribose 5-phosphate isomerase A